MSKTRTATRAPARAHATPIPATAGEENLLEGEGEGSAVVAVVAGGVVLDCDDTADVMGGVVTEIELVIEEMEEVVENVLVEDVEVAAVEGDLVLLADEGFRRATRSTRSRTSSILA